MANTPIHKLARELGMSSKELMGYLRDMGIPAKSPSSGLVPAYVSMAKQKLGPILKARQDEILAQKQAEEERKKAEEELERKRREAERLEVERRRAEERRKAEEERRKAEEARRREEEEQRLEEERKKAEEERNRVRDNAPRATPSFDSLLSQIAQQEEVLRQQAEAASRAKDAARNQGQGRTASRDRQPQMPEPERSGNQERGRKNRKNRRNQDENEDRYSRMARAAEEYNRERVLENARIQVEEANRASAGRRKKRKERRQQQQAQRAEEKALAEALANDQDLSQLDTVKVPQGSTVAELAQLLGVEATDIVKRLFLLGTPLTMTQSMTDDLIELVADDLGRSVRVMTKEEENSFTFYDDPADLVPRSPVVTVMGHVDHGKTSLLDAIRDTGVVASEAGGITQHIGASQVEVDGRTITFVDTPGHETFTAMRARGAKVTDIVILVVAADDGVMPQTVESINHARAAGVPIVVAVNKIDREDANPDRVRQELTEYEVIPEEWGGENMFVNISAKKKIGIDELLETVLLQADVLELKANPSTFASGYVLEAKLDRGRGSVATLLVNRGTLHVGDAVVAGTSHGRVRAMLDQRGRQVASAGPSDAVEILGLSSVPAAGDEFRVFQDERDARNLAEQRALKARIEEQNAVHRVTLENLFETMDKGEISELNLVVKADVQGSIEALRDALAKIDQSEVKINVIHGAVGAITETDVILAAASEAIIIGFGVRPEAKARTLAERDGVEIRTYSVIYQAIEDIDAARIGMLKPTEEEVEQGTAEVREIFRVPKVGVAAGCMVTSGEITRDSRVRIVRDGVVVYDGAFASMRRYKDDVVSVRAGYECGLAFENFQDFHIGDVVEAYRIVEVARTE